MTVEETKHDLLLKRIQITVAILAGLVTLALGIYNVRKNIFAKQNPEEIRSEVATAQPASPIREALEETGASWIKKLGTPKSEVAEDK